jgi:hypothetical protein
MKNNKIVICITTHNRVDCARINMEIIKLNFDDAWPIIHACSNKNYKKYLEDVLIVCEEKKLQKGAFNLLKKSFEAANRLYSPEYIVHIEGDTWLMNQNIIIKYITYLKENPNKFLAASSWSFDKTYKWKKSSNVLKKIKYVLGSFSKKAGLNFHIGWKKTFSTQFFIIKNTKNINQALFKIKEPNDTDHLEKYLYQSLVKKFGNNIFIKMSEREPVHPMHRDFCNDLELFCQHNPTSILDNNSMEMVFGKKEVLKKYNHLKQGKYMKKLLNSKNLDYYNHGAKRI